MKNPELVNKLTRQIGKMGLQLKKHSPEILVVTGTVGVVVSAVLACKATTKLNTILDETKKEVDIIHKTAENPEAQEMYSKEDKQKDLTIAYSKAGLKLIKLYGPSVALGAASIGCILASHNIVHKRNVALSAAYTTVDTSFKNYRKRVVERFGEELDKELKYNVKAQEIEEKVIDEKGEEKTVKRTVQVADPNQYSEFARFYDDGCAGWQKDAEHNLWFLKQQQAWANQKLKTVGYLFLNDVYEMLGIPKTKAGQVVGWVYNNPNKPDSDGYVDFGIYDYDKPRARDFVNGYERTILLDFNVDGNILDLI